jgi:hypothetical protein
MLFGRDREINKLVRNREQGIHTLVFGIEGTGKSALLQELASRPSSIATIYARDCGSRRNLLEGTLKRASSARQISPTALRESLIKDLRNDVVKLSQQQSVCLLLDHLAPLRHRMQRLLEILEEHFTLICAVRAMPGTYSLYYWKFDRLEVGALPDSAARSWIETELALLGCKGSLVRSIGDEVQRLCRGNPGLIADTLKAMRAGTVLLDDPIRVSRYFIDGRLSHLKNRRAPFGR